MIIFIIWFHHLLRRSQVVLQKCLPPKEEHIILVKMAPIQQKLYSEFIQFLARSVGHFNPIRAFHIFTKVSKQFIISV